MSVQKSCNAVDIESTVLPSEINLVCLFSLCYRSGHREPSRLGRGSKRGAAALGDKGERTRPIHDAQSHHREQQYCMGKRMGARIELL